MTCIAVARRQRWQDMAVSSRHAVVVAAGAGGPAGHHRLAVCQRLADVAQVRRQVSLARRVGHHQRGIWRRDRHRRHPASRRHRLAAGRAAGVRHRLVLDREPAPCGCAARWAPPSSCWRPCPPSSTACSVCSCSRRCLPTTSRRPCRTAGRHAAGRLPVWRRGQRHRHSGGRHRAGLHGDAVHRRGDARRVRDRAAHPAESAYGLGCTTWEVVRRVVLPYTQKGVIGGIMLGLGRALGETMAVTFVIGNANRMPTSLFSPGTSIASTLANEFGEAADLSPVHAVRAGLCAVRHHLRRAGGWPRWLIIRAERAKGLRPAPTRDARVSRMQSNNPCTPKRRAANAVGPDLLDGRHGPGPVRAAVDPVRAAVQGLGGAGLEHVHQDTPAPGSEGGGLANAIVGSLMMVGLACWCPRRSASWPASIWPSTATEQDRRADPLRVTDIMLSAPSIVIGLFVYAICVAPVGTSPAGPARWRCR
jgi:hypothetical protein